MLEFLSTSLTAVTKFIAVTMLMGMHIVNISICICAVFVGTFMYCTIMNENMLFQAAFIFEALLTVVWVAKE